MTELGRTELDRDAHRARLVAHIQRHVGVVSGSYVFPVGASQEIELLQVEPTEHKPFHVLVSFGMSLRPMPVPAEVDAPRRAELMLALPEDWVFTPDDPNFAWPLVLLARLAALPGLSGRWLGFGHSVPNGDPPKPYAPTVGFSSAVLVPSIATFAEFHTLDIPGEPPMGVHAVVPLFPGEVEHKIQSGTASLLGRFDRAGVSELLNPGREAVAGGLIDLVNVNRPN